MASPDAAIIGLVKGYQLYPRYRRLLKRNLLLHENFNHKYDYDVILFHEGDISPRHQQRLKSITPNLQFTNIGDRFGPPDDVNVQNEENMGYKNMCRFYSIQLWDLVDDYDYVMRLDDDSYIESEVPLDLFEYMDRNEFTYGHVRRKEDTHQETQQTLPDFVKEYALDNNIDPEWGFENLTSENFYNNLFVTETKFWQRKSVQKYLDHIDQSGKIYEHRWGDSTIMALAVKLFCDPDKVKMLDSFSYCHGSHDWRNYERTKAELVQQKVQYDLFGTTSAMVKSIFK